METGEAYVAVIEEPADFGAFFDEHYRACSRPSLSVAGGPRLMMSLRRRSPLNRCRARANTWSWSGESNPGPPPYHGGWASLFGKGSGRHVAGGTLAISPFQVTTMAVFAGRAYCAGVTRVAEGLPTDLPTGRAMSTPPPFGRGGVHFGGRIDPRPGVGLASPSEVGGE